MARIAFISIADRNAQGVRLMSANLRNNGHECHVIFLKRYPFGVHSRRPAEPDPFAWAGVDRQGRLFHYAEPTPITARELDLLRGLLLRIAPAVIGMTVTTPLRRFNAQVARFIRTFSQTPLIWGGFDATFNARDCLEFCDYVCIGEGDTTILEIAECVDRARSFDHVRNLARLRDGHVVANERAPLVQNLDSLPWRDNEPANKYLIEDGELVEPYPGLNDRPAGVYQTLGSRGCPYRCSYCCEAPLKDLYAGQKFLRRRSARDCVDELANAKASHRIRRVLFEDEVFAMEAKWLEEFCALYRERVALPFEAYLFPSRNFERALRVLQSAGLDMCTISLQSGSPRIQRDVFNRVFDRELFLHAVRLCKQRGVAMFTDVITFNPYEEESDLQDTLDVLLDAGGGFGLGVNKLFVLPGTALYERMARDGKKLDDPAREPVFRHYCRLFWLASIAPPARYLVRWIQRSPGPLRLAALGSIGGGELFAFAYRCYILSRAVAGWVLRRTVAKVFPGLIKFRSDARRIPPEPRSDPHQI